MGSKLQWSNVDQKVGENWDDRQRSNINVNYNKNRNDINPAKNFKTCF
jgi:hypothetical protein